MKPKIKSLSLNGLSCIVHIEMLQRKWRAWLKAAEEIMINVAETEILLLKCNPLNVGSRIL